jgi:hypothetical protein
MDDNERVIMLINWLSVLNKGYVKPDANTSKAPGTSNTTGIVRDTKDFIPYIDKINEELASALNIKSVNLEDVKKRRSQSYN